MRTVRLGVSELVSTRLIYGCMRIAGTWNPAEIDAQRRHEAFAALDAAVQAGYTHFDHADIYAHGACEQLFGEFLRGNRGLRERILITTKLGIRWAGDPDAEAPHRYDFSAEHIERSCEGSLRRLGIDVLDVYLLHRPDVLMNPDEVAAAFDDLQQAGKVRHFGVSNFTPRQTALLQSRLRAPLVCNQIEAHPLQLSPFDDGTLDYLLEHRITPTSWSPLAGGRLCAAPALAGHASPQSAPAAAGPAAADLFTILDREAHHCGVSRAAILHAWLLRHPAGILPIVGTRQPDRIRDAVTADAVELSRAAWYRIYVAARGQPLP